MALDFVGLRTELFARGFDYLNDGGAGLTKAKRYINDAMHQIDDLDDWPYLQATTSGTSPITISDLSKLSVVLDTVNHQPLRQRSQAELLGWAGDLTTTGRASEFYVTGGNTINVFPVSTANIQVIYWKTTPDLVNDSDTPLMPDRFRMAIVEYAVGVALRDEAPDQAAQAVQAGDVIVQRMRNWADELQPRFTYMPMIGDDC